jgi:hypothetical protein
VGAASGGPRFELEAGDQRRICSTALGSNELHRDVAVERLVSGRPDDTHATVPEGAEQAELAREQLAGADLEGHAPSLLEADSHDAA